MWQISTNQDLGDVISNQSNNLLYKTFILVPSLECYTGMSASIYSLIWYGMIGRDGVRKKGKDENDIILGV